MEYWVKGKMRKPNIPFFHHSTIPIYLLGG